MICPNCEQEMIPTNVTAFKCMKCKLVATSLHYNDGIYAWNVPPWLKPSEKQQKTVRFICKILHIDAPPPIRKSQWEFIRDNLQEAIRSSENNRNERQNSRGNWLQF